MQKRNALCPLPPQKLELRKQGRGGDGAEMMARYKSRRLAVNGSSAVCQSGHSGAMLVAVPIGLLGGMDSGFHKRFQLGRSTFRS